MDTTPETPTPNVFKEMLSSGALYRHATALLALAGVATLGIGMIMWASKPGMIPVYEKINKQDTLSITEALRADNIPYEIEAKSGLVLVPTDKLAAVRMKLAANGLVESDNQGIEMLRQDQGFGTSQFIEKARYQHAQETELSRTISSMRNIHSARVHLAMPKQSIFYSQSRETLGFCDGKNEPWAHPRRQPSQCHRAFSSFQYSLHGSLAGHYC